MGNKNTGKASEIEGKPSIEQTPWDIDRKRPDSLSEKEGETYGGKMMHRSEGFFTF